MLNDTSTTLFNKAPVDHTLNASFEPGEEKTEERGPEEPTSKTSDNKHKT